MPFVDMARPVFGRRVHEYRDVYHQQQVTLTSFRRLRIAAVELDGALRANVVSRACCVTTTLALWLLRRHRILSSITK
jgi:hypothetical protein